MGHRGELRVSLIARVAEVLDLRHRELAHAQQPRARRDLVAEPRAHLRRRERELASVEVQQAAEVHEHALRGLGAEEALHRALRTDLRPEHQVERERVRQRIPRRQSHHAVLREQSVQLVRRVRVRLDADVLQLQTLIARQSHVLQQLVHLRLQQLLRLTGAKKQNVSTVALARLAVLHHQVGELVHVACKSDRYEAPTGSLQSTVGSQVGALHFQHVLLQNEVLLPQIDKVALQRAGDRTKIV